MDRFSSTTSSDIGFRRTSGETSTVMTKTGTELCLDRETRYPN